MAYTYEIELKGNIAGLEKDVLDKLQGLAKDVKKDAITIQFDYDIDIKDINKKLDNLINDINPEIGIQFKYDVNKKMLDAAKKQLSDLQDSFDVGEITSKLKKSLSSMAEITKKMNSGLNDIDLSEEYDKTAKATEKLRKTLLALDGGKSAIDELVKSNKELNDEIDYLNKAKIKIEVANIKELENQRETVYSIERALLSLKDQGAIDIDIRGLTETNKQIETTKKAIEDLDTEITKTKEISIDTTKAENAIDDLVDKLKTSLEDIPIEIKNITPTIEDPKRFADSITEQLKNNIVKVNAELNIADLPEQTVSIKVNTDNKSNTNQNNKSVSSKEPKPKESKISNNNSSDDTSSSKLVSDKKIKSNPTNKEIVNNSTSIAIPKKEIVVNLNDILELWEKIESEFSNGLVLDDKTLDDVEELVNLINSVNLKKQFGSDKSLADKINSTLGVDRLSTELIYIQSIIKKIKDINQRQNYGTSFLDVENDSGFNEQNGEIELPNYSKMFEILGDICDRFNTAIELQEKFKSGSKKISLPDVRVDNSNNSKSFEENTESEEDIRRARLDAIDAMKSDISKENSKSEEDLKKELREIETKKVEQVNKEYEDDQGIQEISQRTRELNNRINTLNDLANISEDVSNKYKRNIKEIETVTDELNKNFANMDLENKKDDLTPEQSFAYNSKTGYSTKLFSDATAGSRISVVFDAISDVVTSFIHSHANDVYAAFSFDDILRSIKLIEKGISEQFVMAKDEIIKFDFSKLTNEQITKIGQALKKETIDNVNGIEIAKEEEAYLYQIENNFESFLYDYINTLIQETKKINPNIDIISLKKDLISNIGSIFEIKDDFEEFDDIIEGIYTLFEDISGKYSLSKNDINDILGDTDSIISTKVIARFQEAMLEKVFNQIIENIDFKDIYSRMSVSDFIKNNNIDLSDNTKPKYKTKTNTEQSEKTSEEDRNKINASSTYIETKAIEKQNEVLKENAELKKESATLPSNKDNIKAENDALEKQNNILRETQNIKFSFDDEINNYLKSQHTGIQKVDKLHSAFIPNQVDSYLRGLSSSDFIKYDISELLDIESSIKNDDSIDSNFLSLIIQDYIHGISKTIYKELNDINIYSKNDEVNNIIKQKISSLINMDKLKNIVDSTKASYEITDINIVKTMLDDIIQVISIFKKFGITLNGLKGVEPDALMKSVEGAEFVIKERTTAPLEQEQVSETTIDDFEQELYIIKQLIDIIKNSDFDSFFKSIYSNTKNLEGNIKSILDKLEEVEQQAKETSDAIHTVYRGITLLNGAKHGEVDAISNNPLGTFASSHAEAAYSYSTQNGEEGDVYELQLLAKNIKEIYGRGSAVQVIEFLGDGSDEASKKIIILNKNISDLISNLEKIGDTNSYIYLKQLNPTQMSDGVDYLFRRNPDINSKDILLKIKELASEYKEISDDNSNFYGIHHSDQIAEIGKILGNDLIIIRDIRDGIMSIADTYIILNDEIIKTKKLLSKNEVLSLRKSQEFPEVEDVWNKEYNKNLKQRQKDIISNALFQPNETDISPELENQVEMYEKIASNIQEINEVKEQSALTDAEQLDIINQIAETQNIKKFISSPTAETISEEKQAIESLTKSEEESKEIAIESNEAKARTLEDVRNEIRMNQEALEKLNSLATYSPAYDRYKAKKQEYSNLSKEELYDKLKANVGSDSSSSPEDLLKKWSKIAAIKQVLQQKFNENIKFGDFGFKKSEFDSIYIPMINAFKELSNTNFNFKSKRAELIGINNLLIQERDALLDTITPFELVEDKLREVLNAFESAPTGKGIKARKENVINTFKELLSLKPDAKIKDYTDMAESIVLVNNALKRMPKVRNTENPIIPTSSSQSSDDANKLVDSLLEIAKKEKKVVDTTHEANQELEKQNENLEQRQSISTPNLNISNSNDENDNLDNLNKKLPDIVENIDKKTESFRNEDVVVEKVVSNEISNLNRLIGSLQEIETQILFLIQKIELIPNKNIDIKIGDVSNLENFEDNEIFESLKKLSESISESLFDSFHRMSLDIKAIGNNPELATNIQHIANSLLNLKSNINNLSMSGNELLGTLKFLVSNKKNVEEILGILNKESSKPKSPSVVDEPKSPNTVDESDKPIVGQVAKGATNIDTDPHKAIKRGQSRVNEVDTSMTSEELQARTNALKLATDILEQEHEDEITSITDFFDSQGNLLKTVMKTEEFVGDSLRKVTYTTNYNKETGETFTSNIITDDFKAGERIANKPDVDEKEYSDWWNDAIKEAEKSSKEREKVYNEEYKIRQKMQDDVIKEINKSADWLSKNEKSYQDLNIKKENSITLTDKERNNLKDLREQRQKNIDILNKYANEIELAKDKLSEFKNIENISNNKATNNLISDYESNIDEIKNKLSSLYSGKFIDEFKVEIQALIKKLNDIDIEKVFNARDIDSTFKDIEEKFNLIVKNSNLVSNKSNSYLTLEKYQTKIEDLLNKNSAMSDELKLKFKSLNKEISNMQTSKTFDENDLGRIKIQFQELNTEMIRSGKIGKSFFDTMTNRIKQMSTNWISMYFSMYDIIRYLREMANTIIEVDSAMVELRKVSNATDNQLNNSLSSATTTAKELGASINEIISAQADWSRLGYGIEEADELARVSQLYVNVGDNIDISSANESLISTLKGFNLDTNEAESIVDKFNEVANNYAIDSAGIGEALQRSAAAFNAANTDLSKSIALITTANTIAQDPEKVGNAFTTLSARIRGSKSELEDLGEETDAYVESTSKLRAQVKATTGVDIMENETTYKDIYTILVEIGKVWKNLNDVDQAALLEALAGKRQSNIMAGLLNNADILENVYATAENSAGSALREQENFQKGITYSINQFKATLEEWQIGLMNSNIIKFFIDLGTEIIDFSNKIGTLGSTLTLAIGTLTLFKKNFQVFKINDDNKFTVFGKSINDLVESVNIKKYAKEISNLSEEEAKWVLNNGSLTESQKELAISLSSHYDTLTTVSKTEAEIIGRKSGLLGANESLSISENELTLAKWKEIAASEGENAALAKEVVKKYENDVANKKLAISTKALSVATTLLSTALNMGLMIALSAAVQGIQYLASANERYIESIDSSIDKSNESISNYDNEISSLEDLQDKLKDAKGNRESLISIYDDLNSKITNATEVINGESGAYESANDQIEKNIELLKKQKKAELSKKISNAKTGFNNLELENNWGFDLSWDELKSFTTDGVNTVKLVQEEGKKFGYTSDAIIKTWAEYFSNSDDAIKFGLVDPNTDEVRSFFEKRLDYAKESFEGYFEDSENPFKISETGFENILSDLVYYGNNLDEIQTALDSLFNNKELGDLYSNFTESLSGNSTLNTKYIKEELLNALENIDSTYFGLTDTINDYKDSIDNSIDKSITVDFGSNREQLKQLVKNKLDIDENLIWNDVFLKDFSDQGIKNFINQLNNMSDSEIDAIKSEIKSGVKDREEQIGRELRKGNLDDLSYYKNLVNDIISRNYQSSNFKDIFGLSDDESSINKAIENYKTGLSEIQSDILSLEDATPKELTKVMSDLSSKYNEIFSSKGEWIEFLNGKQIDSKDNVTSMINEQIRLLDKNLDKDTINNLNKLKEIIEGIYREELRATHISKAFIENVKALRNMQNSESGWNTIDSIYADVYNQETFDWSSILNNDEFDNIFSQFTEEYIDFINTITNSPNDIKKCQDAFDNLATAFIWNDEQLVSVTEDTKEATIAYYEQMGVVNATELVETALANRQEIYNSAKKYGVEIAEDYNDITAEEVARLMDEVDELDTATIATINLWMAKQDLANVELFSSDELLALDNYIKKLDQTSFFIGKLARAKIALAQASTEDLNRTYMYNGQSMTYGEYLKQFIEDVQNEGWVEEEINDAIQKANVKKTKTKVQYTGGTQSKSEKDKKDSSSSSDNKTDWIEVLLGRDEEAINRFNQVAENQNKKLNTRYNAYGNVYSSTQKEITDARNGAVRYFQEANKVTGLSKDIISRIQNGTIDINLYDEDTQKKISEYQTWFNKGVAARDKANELEKNNIENRKNQYQLYIDFYKSEQSASESIQSRIQTLLKMRESNGQYGYDSMYKNIDNELISQISLTKKQNSELIKQRNLVEKGSEAFNNYTAEINNNNNAILNLTQSLMDNAEAWASVESAKSSAFKEKLDAKDSLYSAKEENETSYASKNKYVQLRSDNIDKTFARYNRELANNNKKVQTTRSAALGVSSKNSKLQGLINKAQTAIKQGKKVDTNVIAEITKLDGKIGDKFIKYNAAVVASEASKAQVDLYNETSKQEKAQLALSKLSNVQTYYSNRQSVRDQKSQQLNNAMTLAETQGYVASTKYYDKLNNIEKNTNSSLKTERTKLVTELNKAVANGSITVYSDEWYDAVGKINDVTNAIAESDNKLAEFENNIQQLKWTRFDDLNNDINNFESELDFIINQLSRKDLTKDDLAGLTDEGRAVQKLQLAKYTTSAEQAQMYLKSIQDLDKQYANDKYNTNYIEQREKLIESYRNEISASEDAKYAIIDLYEQGYQALSNHIQEVISDYEELLDAEKDAYDYQKNIEEKTKNISNLRKQLLAYANDTSEEARTKIQTLTVSLEDAEKDLQETQYDKYLSNTKDMLSKFKEDLDDNIQTIVDNLDKNFTSVIDTINKIDVSTTIQLAMDEVGYSLSKDATKVSSSKNVEKTTDSTISSIETNQKNAISKADTKADKTDTTTVENELTGKALLQKEIQDAKSKANKKDSNSMNKYNALKYISANNDPKAKHSSGANKIFYERYGIALNDAQIKTLTNSILENTVKVNGKPSLYQTLKKAGLPGFSVGSSNIEKDLLAFLGEGGNEIQFDKSKGVLREVGMGDKIFTSEMANNLWDLANLNPNLINGVAPNIVPITSNISNNQNVTLNLGGITMNEVNNPEQFTNNLIDTLQHNTKVNKLLLNNTIGTLNSNQNSLSNRRY